MKIVKRMISMLSEIICLIILLYVVLWAPIILGFKPRPVLTDIMEPAYQKGSIIYYKKIPKEKLKIGDAVTIRVDTTLVSQRIVNIENDTFTTKGEAFNGVDTYNISYEKIKGKDAKVVIRYIGYFLSFMNQYLFIIMVITFTILPSNYFLNRRKPKEREEKKEKTEEPEII